MTTMLGYAILGVLAREACSGYDLTQLLKVRVGSFWQAQHSQIYPELARLEAAGHVTHQRIEQSDRPDKKLFAITDAGRAELRAWLGMPMQPPARRDEFVLKSFSVWMADPGRAAAEFREHGAFHRERQAHYEQLLAEKCPNGAPPFGTPMFSSYIGFVRGIGYEREYADWCTWVADLIERHSKQ